MRRHYRPAVLRHLATMIGTVIIASVITSGPVSFLQQGPQVTPNVEVTGWPAAGTEAATPQAPTAVAVMALVPTSQPAPPADASSRQVNLPVAPQPSPSSNQPAAKPAPSPVPQGSLVSSGEASASGGRSASLQSLSLDLAEIDPGPASSPEPVPTVAPTAVPPAPPTAVPTAALTPAPTATPAPAPTAAPEPAQDPSHRVGIQAGHWKNAELPDELKILRGSTGAAGSGWTEVAVNLDVARRVAAILESHNVQVDLLPATVPVAYRADAFVSIHADANTNTKVSGYKAARARASAIPQKDDALVNALRGEYKAATSLPEHPNTITPNMTSYYAFNNRLFKHAVHPETPSAIFETVFMTTLSDRQFILQQPDKVAEGIASGILKFLGVN